MPLLVLALGVAATVCVVIAYIGAAVAERARAQHAADAAALAGALGGADAAREIAAANDARLESFAFAKGSGETGSDLVTVVVRHGRFAAEARAERLIELTDG
jgi:Flp pilus assembly protein TadG